MEDHETYIRRAIERAKESAKEEGGPFGCVVVKENDVIAEASNSVTAKNDPTAHAEIEAIRLASQKLGTFNLKGCVLYTSSYPCPMCFGAIYWARIESVYYANKIEVAAKAGFDDSSIHNELCGDEKNKSAEFKHILIEDAEEPFNLWRDNSDKTAY